MNILERKHYEEEIECWMLSPSYEWEIVVLKDGRLIIQNVTHTMSCDLTTCLPPQIKLLKADD